MSEDGSSIDDNLNFNIDNSSQDNVSLKSAASEQGPKTPVGIVKTSSQFKFSISIQ